MNSLEDSMDYYKNNLTNKIFISIDGESLISPNGKKIELNEDLFEEIESGELSEIQLRIIDNLEKNFIENLERERNQKNREIERDRIHREREMERIKKLNEYMKSKEFSKELEFLMELFLKK